MSIYGEFSDDYDNLYKNNISIYQNNCKAITQENYEYVDFYPSFGVKTNEKSEFLIYGQAVNGWRDGFCLYETIDLSKKLENSKYESIKFYEIADHSPLDNVI